MTLKIESNFVTMYHIKKLIVKVFFKVVNETAYDCKIMVPDYDMYFP